MIRHEQQIGMPGEINLRRRRVPVRLLTLSQGFLGSDRIVTSTMFRPLGVVGKR